MPRVRGWIRSIAFAALLLAAPAAAVAGSSAAAAVTSATVTVSPPGDQTTVLGNVVFTHIMAADTGGTLPLSFMAAGLPGGPAINPDTGLVSGTTTS